jgi:hypothetical protein
VDNGCRDLVELRAISGVLGRQVYHTIEEELNAELRSCPSDGWTGAEAVDCCISSLLRQDARDSVLARVTGVLPGGLRPLQRSPARRLPCNTHQVKVDMLRMRLSSEDRPRLRQLLDSISGVRGVGVEEDDGRGVAWAGSGQRRAACSSCPFI